MQRNVYEQNNKELITHDAQNLEILNLSLNQLIGFACLYIGYLNVI